MSDILRQVSQGNNAVAAYLARLKARQPTAPQHGVGRLIFGLDATASREPTWDQATRIQHEMFDATAGLGGISTQLCFFRGYGECKTSSWVSSAAGLHRLMASVRCEAGVTQIGRVLEHAIRETSKAQVAALVYVGDTCEEPAGPLLDAAARLRAARTPVFVFHEDAQPWIDNDELRALAGLSTREATVTLQSIARLSGGEYLLFDLSNVDRLKELLGAIAVFASGDQAALASYGQRKGGEVLRLTQQLQLTDRKG
jgi:hypothetical protein